MATQLNIQHLKSLRTEELQRLLINHPDPLVQFLLERVDEIQDRADDEVAAAQDHADDLRDELEHLRERIRTLKAA